MQHLGSLPLVNGLRIEGIPVRLTVDPGLEDLHRLRSILLIVGLQEHILAYGVGHHRSLGQKLLGRNIAQTGIVHLQHFAVQIHHIVAPAVLLRQSVVKSSQIHVIGSSCFAAAGGQQAAQGQGHSRQHKQFLHSTSL